MATKVNRTNRNRRSHDRRAMLQWLAIGLVLVVAFLAVLIFTDGDRNGGHSGAPAVGQAL